MLPAQLTTLPNLITLARILVIPVICVFVVSGWPLLQWLALLLFIIAAVSDWVDGYLARRMNLGSAVGRMLDPIADKLLVGALLVTLAWTRDLSALDLIPAIAILLREIFVSGLREYLGNAGVTIPVSFLAKWKTTVQLVALALAETAGRAEVEAELPYLYKSNYGFEEFCIQNEVNPINAWYWFRESGIVPVHRAHDIALEFLADLIREVLMEDDDGIIPLVRNAGEDILLDRLEQPIAEDLRVIARRPDRI